MGKIKFIFNIIFFFPYVFFLFIYWAKNPLTFQMLFDIIYMISIRIYNISYVHFNLKFCEHYDPAKSSIFI